MWTLFICMARRGGANAFSEASLRVSETPKIYDFGLGPSEGAK